MAKCEFCDKGVTFGIKVSHSHRRSNRTWKPNVKRVKAIVDGLCNSTITETSLSPKGTGSFRFKACLPFLGKTGLPRPLPSPRGEGAPVSQHWGG